MIWYMYINFYDLYDFYILITYEKIYLYKIWHPPFFKNNSPFMVSWIRKKGFMMISRKLYKSPS